MPGCATYLALHILSEAWTQSLQSILCCNGKMHLFLLCSSACLAVCSEEAKRSKEAETMRLDEERKPEIRMVDKELFVSCVTCLAGQKAA